MILSLAKFSGLVTPEIILPPLIIFSSLGSLEPALPVLDIAVRFIEPKVSKPRFLTIVIVFRDPGDVFVVERAPGDVFVAVGVAEPAVSVSIASVSLSLVTLVIGPTRQIRGLSLRGLDQFKLFSNPIIRHTSTGVPATGVRGRACGFVRAVSASL